ncbi:MAG: hypothetical protein OHK0044_02520 [Burkholderiaceae bacterium]
MSGRARMNEAEARRVLLVRAYETTPNPVWTDTDRAWASRAAAEVEGAEAPLQRLIARRAALAAERLAERDRNVARALRALAWRPWVATAIAVVAFISGIAVDAIGPAQRINLLAPPLAALLAWNVALYVLIAVRGALGIFSARAREPGPLSRAFARLLHRQAPAAASAPLATFVADWTRAIAPLAAARVGRVLHVAAIALALGLLAGLYVRGLVLEYRAGWESTFLDARAVHAVLSALLAPAAAATGIALPDPAGFEALRFAAGGANAAPWLNLFATTVALVVLAPRLLLALGDRWYELRLARRFPLRLDEPYFRNLARALRDEPQRVRVAPYAVSLSPQAALNLNALVAQALGTRATLAIAPVTAFGAEDDADAGSLVADATLVVALFAATATPEVEHHGVFVDRLAAAGDVQVIALVDESEFRHRFGAGDRLEERRAAWRTALADRRVPALFVDLAQPDLPAAEAALRAAIT